MINELRQVFEELPYLLREKDKWDSLLITRRKPTTYRIFRQWPTNPEVRICLHKFEPCISEEAFVHPHPWPGSFMVLEGGYSMPLGSSIDLEARPTDFSMVYLKAGSSYSITSPKVWHAVIPDVPTYTLMVNGLPWENPHKFAPTTKGKDLEKIPEEDLQIYLEDFFFIVEGLKTKDDRRNNRYQD